MIRAGIRAQFVAQRAILAQSSRFLPYAHRQFISTTRSAWESDKTNDSNETPKWSTLKERLESPPGGKSKSKSRSKSKSKSKKKSKSSRTKLDVKVLRPKDIPFTPLETERAETAQLSHGLEKVLFNAGVYQLQDPRSKVYNFDPYLTSIMPIEQFDFDALKQYITSSKDVKLREMSAKHGLKYCGSTSSMTNILSHFHFLLSAWRDPNFSNLSGNMKPEYNTFTSFSRAPAAAYVRLQDGVYAIDADKEFDRDNVLSMLGRSMEKLLTLPKDEFEKYRRTRSHLLSEEERNADESFHYTTLGDFLMRSQLDAHDPRLPGTGVFDLKTRAVVTVRMDVSEYEERRGYEIKQQFGRWESFEREYHDMIRAAFLKYSLQVRMGRMDGVFVAYHNTQRIFGFHYIPLEEMDKAIHGTQNRILGDQEFRSSVALLNELLDRAVEKYPGRSLRLHVETRPTKVPLTYFFVEPVTDEDMKKSDEVTKRSTAKYAEEIKDQSQKVREAIELSQQHQEPEPESDPISEDASQSTNDQETQSDDAWEALITKVEETVESESLGRDVVREALSDALEHGSLLGDSTTEENQQYLDALVEALTDLSPGTKEIQEAAENRSGLDASTIRKDESQNDEGVEKVGGEKPNMGEDGADVVADEKVITTETPTPSTLRDLILKVTERINDKKVGEMRAFERMVAELVARTKQTDVKHGMGTKVALDANNEEVTDTVDESLSEEATQATKVDESGAQKSGPRKPELLGMFVTIRNRVNGQSVERPKEPETKFNWDIEYAITELPDHEAQTLYRQIKKRRYDIHSKSGKGRHGYQDLLTALSKKGETYRKSLNKEQEGKSVYVAWEKNPLSADESSPATEEDQPSQKAP